MSVESMRFPGDWSEFADRSMIDTATTVPWTATVIQVSSGLTFRSIDRPGVAESDPSRTSTSVGWTARRMLNDIYSRRILELAADIPLQGTLPGAHGSAKAHSKLCGSTVTVYLKLDGNVISAFTHEVKACALGSSLLIDHGAACDRFDRRGASGAPGGHASHAEGRRGSSFRQVGRLGAAGTGAGPKSPSRLDPPHFRRCGRCACPSPSGQEGTGCHGYRHLSAAPQRALQQRLAGDAPPDLPLLCHSGC